MLSVVIPTYNRANYLSRAVDSLRTQNFSAGDFEIIIIDDGSRDNTAEVAKKFHNSNCRYFRQEHRGVSAARNLGVEKSAGEIIVFFDDDAIADKNWLTNIAKIMTRENIITGRVEPISKNIWRYFAPHYYQGEKPTESSALLEGNCAIRREVFNKIGGFDAELDYGHEGEEFITRARQNYQIKYYPEMIIYHNYAFGLLNYLKKQFKFGEKAAYLKIKNGEAAKKAISQNELLNHANWWTKVSVKLIARLGRLSYLGGQVFGQNKYRRI